MTLSLLSIDPDAIPVTEQARKDTDLEQSRPREQARKDTDLGQSRPREQARVALQGDVCNS